MLNQAVFNYFARIFFFCKKKKGEYPEMNRDISFLKLPIECIIAFSKSAHQLFWHLRIYYL